MAKVPLNKPAPEFNLTAFSGEQFSLSDMRGRKNTLLVFNRTFQ
jgi:peroxiredoxin